MTLVLPVSLKASTKKAAKAVSPSPATRYSPPKIPTTTFAAGSAPLIHDREP